GPMLARLAQWCYNNRWKVIGLWLFALVALFGWGGAVGTSFDGGRELPASDSARGFELLDQYFPGRGAGLSGSIVFQSTAGVTDPAVKAAMEATFAKIDALGTKPNDVTVDSPYAEPMGKSQINPDGTVAFATINLDKKFDQTESGKLGTKIVKLLPEMEGLRTEVGGSVLAEFKPPSSELIGLAFAIVVLILSFGSVLAMGLPIAVALAGVGSGMALVMLLSNTLQMPEFSTTIGAMIGLGVGIDYALFIVTRFREGLHEGLTPEHATMRAMDTAGRSVIFAGITVVISLLGMLLLGLAFISGLGIASAVTVAVTMIASTTLLPALLGLARERVEITRWRGLIAAGLIALAMLAGGLKAAMPVTATLVAAAVMVFVAGFAVKPLKAYVPPRKHRPNNETTAYKWSHFIQRHPLAALLFGVIVIGVIGLPIFSLRLGFSDDGNFPENTTTRQAYDLLAEGFGPGFNGPLIVVARAEGPNKMADITKLAEALKQSPGIAQVGQPVPNNVADLVTVTDPSKIPAVINEAEAFLIRVIPTTSPQNPKTETLVKDLRSSVVPTATEGTGLTVNVAGYVAIGIDFTTYLSEKMVLFFVAVLTLSFLLLMVVFRSLLVPLKAVIMNLLSIAAAYGVVVAVFQWGWLGSLTGIEPAPIEPFLPIMMFAIVFGLSMDYEVFLLSRVKEEYDRHGDPRNSVADGLAATARVITAAAAIMVVVFGSFLFEENRIPQLFGLGLATAVLLDATLVRMLLVPATMELLGAKNWWIPKWLDRILPRVDIEGTTSELAAANSAEAPAEPAEPAEPATV
ncbi:MAG TPA: MMPL family transporter, partial [Acidimicrobiaceae bacterium]|nr:MMPL family transporter [Acidimicrobiaceae bacterium]